jgi:hypothetical protein
MTERLDRIEAILERIAMPGKRTTVTIDVEALEQ